MRKNVMGEMSKPFRKVALVVGSAICEPIFVSQIVLHAKDPFWILIPTMMNFILTYGYDWGVFSQRVVLFCFLLNGWYFQILSFVPFLIATFAYDRVIPWAKNIMVALMYSLNFLVIPWAIKQGNDPLPTTFLCAYIARIVAFEMYDDLQDWEEDASQGRKTMVRILGKRASALLIPLVLGVSGTLYADHRWKVQTIVDLVIMLIGHFFRILPGITWGRGWMLGTMGQLF